MATPTNCARLPGAEMTRNSQSPGGEVRCTCPQDRPCSPAVPNAPPTSSSSSSPEHSFSGVTNPPGMYHADQDSDLVTGSPNQVDSLAQQLQAALCQVDHIQQEKSDVLRKLKDVTKMNSRWQKYDREREAVVQDLTGRLKEAEAKLQHLEAKVQALRDQNEEMELGWTDARVRATQRKTEVERLQREVQHLEHGLQEAEKKQREAESKQRDAEKRLHEAEKKQLKAEKKHQEAAGRLEAVTKQGARADKAEEKDSDKDRDLFFMSKRVVDLKDRVEYLERQRSSLKKQLQEQADLYTQQINICLDDFKHEKKDKDKAKTENSDLKKQLKNAEDFANSLKAQITRYQDQHPHRASPNIPKRIHLSPRQVNKYYGNFSDELSNSWDDVGYDLPSDVVRDHGADNIGYDEIDGGVARPGNAHAQAPVDPPPHYDDRSVLGQVVVFPKTCRDGLPNRAIAVARCDDLVLH